eukprot:m.811357 g.811357  ORF g.811357 m.811357 type:complete len:83 (-) comp59334_c0_seq3:3211-3459(-)
MNSAQLGLNSVRRVNVQAGPVQDKMLMTGLHAVCDVHCLICRQYVGWKYENAYEQEQKYKIGKFILEKGHLAREDETESDPE